MMAVFIAVSCSDDSTNNAGMPGDGQGGSLAIFALKGDYLYTVDHSYLNVFSLLNPQGPVKVNQVQVGFDIETLFSDADNLYIGSRTGMYIYSVTNPEDPLYVGEAHHVTACDPVVSNGTHAFVTLHSNAGCGNTINALMIYDIADPANPQLINSRVLTQPKGMGLYSHYLVVCDDEIKIFDITYPDYPHLVGSINKQCHDVIIRGNQMFAIADHAVYTYTLNEANISSVTLNSEIVF
ncbi:hypothetical protein SAMN05444144_102388 [Flavobacterium akiainvivens]|nr:hypothetical protein SAMN05444144_102388 [Flavobacterium akiainvivens]